MNDRIRVLAIAPYEGMKQLMTAMANDYPQIDLTVFVGDREQGLQIAKDNFHGNYDAVPPLCCGRICASQWWRSNCLFTIFFAL